MINLLYIIAGSCLLVGAIYFWIAGDSGRAQIDFLGVLFMLWKLADRNSKL